MPAERDAGWGPAERDAGWGPAESDAGWGPAERSGGELAAVLWDMDGTLVDSEKVWTVSLRDTAHRLGGELSAEAREAMIGSNMPRTIGLMFDDLGLAPDVTRMDAAAAFLTERTGELFASGLVWRPGARDALRMVRATGLASALVTNTERGLTEAALDAIGREHFDVSVCGDEVPDGKPAPDPYLRAALMLGVEPGECLAIEDSPTGTLAAERAGVAVLVVPCDVDVPPAPGRIVRPTLVGLTAQELRDVHARIAGGRPGIADSDRAVTGW